MTARFAPDRPAGILGEQWQRDQIARAEALDAAAMERHEREECRLPPGSGIAIAAILSAAVWCVVAAIFLAVRIWG